jgi:hypothetical protein
MKRTPPNRTGFRYTLRAIFVIIIIGSVPLYVIGIGAYFFSPQRNPPNTATPRGNETRATFTPQGGNLATDSVLPTETAFEFPTQIAPTLDFGIGQGNNSGGVTPIGGTVPPTRFITATFTPTLAVTLTFTSAPILPTNTPQPAPILPTTEPLLPATDTPAP